MKITQTTKGSRRFVASIAAALLLSALLAPAAAQAAPLITESSFSAVGESAATLRASVDPNGRASTARFLYTTQSAYEAEGFTGASSAPATPIAVPLSVTGTGKLEAGSPVISEALASAGHFGPGQAIKGEGIPAETTITKLEAGAGGTLTLTLSKSATATRTSSLGAAGPQLLETQLTGLRPGTAYRARAVAQNAKPETTEGEVLLFATLPAAPVFGPCPNEAFRTGVYAPAGRPSAALPDCRAYEQVSPVDKDGSDILGRTVLVKAAPEGDAATFGSTFGIPGGEGAEQFPFYVARRGEGEDGWATRGLLPPPSVGQKAKPIGWSPDLSEDYIQATRQGNPKTNALFAHDTASGALTRITPYLPGGPGIFYVGASTDGATVLFETTAALPPKEGEPPIPGAFEGAQNVYAWDRATDEVHLAGIGNEGALPGSSGSIAGPYGWVLGSSARNLREGGAANSYYLQDTHAVTQSGSVYFTAAGSGQLYLRRNPTMPQSPLNGQGECTEPDKACTIHVSATQKDNGGPGHDGPDPAGEQPVVFQAASADGSKVFFTSHEKLTDDANTGPEQPLAQIGAAKVSGEEPEEVEEGALPAHTLGMAADPAGEYLYWADPTLGTIARAKLDAEGKPEEPAESAFLEPGETKAITHPDSEPGIFHSAPSTPRYVAVDAHYLYWTNTGPLGGEETVPHTLEGGGSIGRATIDPAECALRAEPVPCQIEPEFITGASNPQGIAVSGTHVYWANAASELISRSISRAELGGGGVKREYVSSSVFGQGSPTGMTLVGGFLYFAVIPKSAPGFSSIYGIPTAWAEQESEVKSMSIGPFEGTGLPTQIRDIAVVGSYVYWASAEASAIGRADLSNVNLDGFYCPASKCEYEYLTPEGTPFGLASSGSHLYWSVNGEAATNPGNDLYRFEPETETLTDLTPDTEDENGAEVQGVLGVSEGGSRVYLAANGDLDGPGGPGTQGDCEGIIKSSSGRCGLYLLEAGKAPRFVAELNASGNQPDSLNWVGTPVEALNTGSYEPKTAFLGEEGKFLLFRSREQLTPYENEGVPEFYRYSAADGSIACASCLPSGEAGGGEAGLGNFDTFPNLKPNAHIAAVASRNLSADGRRVFFETARPLLLGDTNGAADVYEWEAPGEGSCFEGGPGYSLLNSGCLYLISPGDLPGPSYFLDASEDGDDAFFFTRTRLVGQDRDPLVDVYDARVQGGLASQNPLPTVPCEGEACRGPAQVLPAQASPATAGFHGPPDPKPKPCAKGRVRRGARCVKAPRKQKHAHHHRKRAKGAMDKMKGGRR